MQQKIESFLPVYYWNIYNIKNFKSDNIHQQDNFELVVKCNHYNFEVIKGL